MPSNLLTFPNDFIWGAATSSYQIEGACNEDGRGSSIWDTFCDTPGKVRHGHTGCVTVDHYHRTAEDLAIMRTMQLKAYRFSVAWPRIQPTGSGPANLPGLDFYDRLVDGLLAQEMRPFLTLYHWDLPQALEDAGGWTNRDTAYRFADYAHLVIDRLGDRVKDWITHNEPWVAAMLGYYTGENAPGRTAIHAAHQATHHLLLSHGLAAQALRSASHPAQNVGITLNLSPIYPASDRLEDQQAAFRQDGYINRLFLDPVFRGSYPQDIVAYFGSAFPQVTPEDLHTIQSPLEFLGINYYTRGLVAADPGVAHLGLRHLQPQHSEYSQMWEIYPDGLYDLLSRLNTDYRPAALYITENGIPVADGLDADGRVRDYRRLRYVRDHLQRCHAAIQSGVPLKGYFHWSLLDNFEWAFGYDMRFGMVYVDFETQQRIIKDSGRWYAGVIQNNAIDLGFHPC